MMGDLWFWFAVAGLALGAVFAALQLSLRDSARTKLEAICAKRRRPRTTARVNRITEDVDAHAAAVSVPRIASNLLVALSVVAWFDALSPSRSWDWTAIAAGLAVATALVWVFGMILPMSIAAHAGEKTVYAASGLIRAAYLALRPFLVLARFTDEVVRRLTGSEQDDQIEREAELFSVVAEGEREGQFDEDERGMIESVVSLRSTTVGQIMTPRTEIDALELTNDLGAVIGHIRRSGHSRIPVYKGSVDHVVGLFYVKDLMRWLAGEGARGPGKPFELSALLRPAIFVPETKTVRELLRELLDHRVHIAVVADEFGGVAGLVTIEDIIEEVFGEIQDEYEQPGDETPEVIVDEAGGTALLDGRTYMDDANAELRRLGVSLPASEDYSTVGGYVVTSLGRIPERGVVLAEGRARITVVDAGPTRVNRVRVEVIPGDEPVTESALAADRQDVPAAAMEPATPDAPAASSETRAASDLPVRAN